MTSVLYANKTLAPWESNTIKIMVLEGDTKRHVLGLQSVKIYHLHVGATDSVSPSPPHPQPHRTPRKLKVQVDFGALVSRTLCPKRRP